MDKMKVIIKNPMRVYDDLQLATEMGLPKAVEYKLSSVAGHPFLCSGDKAKVLSQAKHKVLGKTRDVFLIEVEREENKKFWALIDQEGIEFIEEDV